MKYKLIKYKTKLALTTRAMNCILTFEKYIFGFKIGTKVVNVYLSDYVTWKDFFNNWDESIKNGEFYSKEALKKTIY